MYEHITYDLLLNRMLDRVPEGIDKREGSLIYNALAPAAAEQKLMYIEADAILKETYADTASREYLIKRAAEKGMKPEEATKAIVKGVFNVDVAIGERFSLEQLNYIVTEKISTGIYKLECETSGSAANNNIGSLIPIGYIAGLTSAELTEILIPGEDEEETETFRTRYFERQKVEPFGGNQADYIEKTNKLDVVGGVRVTPNWAGGSTVKLSIIDSNFNAPSAAVVDEVQTAIDPVANSGDGVGLAPIGHFVTVEGATAETINIATTITFESGWVWGDIQTKAETAIDEYFLELIKTWEDTNIIVRISQIEMRLLDLPGVVDITGTTINGLTQNAALGDKIPVRGSISG